MDCAITRIYFVYPVHEFHVTEMSQWIAEFSRRTQTNWNLRDMHTELKVLQRKDFVCHMNNYHNRPVKQQIQIQELRLSCYHHSEG